MSDVDTKHGYRIRRWELIAMPVVPAVFAIVTLTNELSALSILARAVAVWAIVDAVRAHKNFPRKWAEAVILAGGALVLAGIVLGTQTELVIAVFLETLLAVGLLEGWSLERPRSGPKLSAPVTALRKSCDRCSEMASLLIIAVLLLAFPLSAQRASLDTLAVSPPLSDPSGVLSPVSAFFDDRGGVWITDLNEAEVGVLDVGSQRWQIVGRRGSGPGEFRAPIRIGRSGDSIWVYDNRLRRLSFFRGRRLVGSAMLPANLAAIDGTPEFLTVGAGTRGVSVVRSNVRSPFGAAVTVRGTVMAHSLDNAGGRGSNRSLFVVEGPSTEIVFATRTRGVAGEGRAQNPFLFSPLIVADGTGGVVVLTKSGERTGLHGRLRMTSLDSSGVRSDRVIEVPATPASPHVRADIIEKFCTVAGPASAQPVCDRRELTRALGRHDYLPLVAGAVACQESSGLWLQRADWPHSAPVEYRFISGSPQTTRDFVFAPGTRVIGCAGNTVALVQMEGRSALSPVVIGRVRPVR